MQVVFIINSEMMIFCNIQHEQLLNIVHWKTGFKTIECVILITNNGIVSIDYGKVKFSKYSKHQNVKQQANKATIISI